MMQTDVSFLIAFIAGIISFLSPCVLPLIPSYISFISGASPEELSRGTADRRVVLLRTVFFVLGFSIVFVVLGLLFSGPALLFSPALQWINLIAGLVVILLGVHILFDIASFLHVERRVHLQSRPAGALGATVAGMAFGAGWSPCIGPILASILFLAGTSGEVLRGAFLLLTYSAGLGIPFLITGFAFERVSRYLKVLKSHVAAIRTGSGLFLIGMGLLIAAGRFQQLNGWLVSTGIRFEMWGSQYPAIARLIIAGIFLGIVVIYLGMRVGIQKQRPRTRSTIALVALLVLAVLQWYGTIDLVRIISGWLMFQGI